MSDIRLKRLFNLDLYQFVGVQNIYTPCIDIDNEGDKNEITKKLRNKSIFRVLRFQLLLIISRFVRKT